MNGVFDSIYFNFFCYILYKNKGYEIEIFNGFM